MDIVLETDLLTEIYLEILPSHSSGNFVFRLINSTLIGPMCFCWHPLVTISFFVF